MSKFLRDGERIDDLQNGRFLIQNPSAFCFGIDAVLLAHYPAIRPDDRILDMGCGNGAVPMIMSAVSATARFTGLEILGDMADMARRSAAMNGLEDRIDIVTGDIKEAVRLFGTASFSLITCNPPYMPEGHGKANEGGHFSVARHEIAVGLPDIAAVSSKLLREKGRLAMIHRPARLAEIIGELRKNRLEPKRMRFVFSYSDREASLVLIEAVKGGKPYLKVESPLVIYGSKGKYTEEVLRIYGKTGP